MRSKLKKWLNFILIAILLLAGAVILYSTSVYIGDYPEYSTYNAEENGIKAMYLLTGKMGYRTERYHYPAVFLTEQAVMVAFHPDNTLFDEEKEIEGLKAWLLKDNTLILIPDEETLNQLWIFEFISEHKQWHEVVNIGDITTTWYGLEKGTICVMDQSWSFINKNLAESDASVAFIRALERLNASKVVFNEYYRDIRKDAPGVWDLIGSAGRLASVQLLAALILTFIRNWKTFGRARGEEEWSNRPENEMQKALAGLYMRMKAYPLALANYYGYFTRKYSRFLNSPGVLQDKARRVLAFCERYIEDGERNRKRLLVLVNRLDKIEDEIKKGVFRNRSMP